MNTHIFSLTPEIMGKIVGHLPLDDRFRIQKTCHLWHSYTFDTSFKNSSKIAEIWDSYQTCEVLLNKLLPDRYEHNSLKVCLRNNRAFLVGKASLYTAANM